jgi:lycopene beta-cyclase
MSNNFHFDYIIIGNGLAGLQLALKLATDSFFNDKQIALIDPSTKSINDKTWSFWEIGNSSWDNIVHKSWTRASIITSEKTIDLKLNPYRYKTIHSIDFYNLAKSRLRKHNNIHFVIDNVISINEEDLIKVETKKHSYFAKHVFDSRIPEAFAIASKSITTITQHFKGWIIKTTNDVFDETIIKMMDYRLKDNNQTTFMYVLPFTKTEALVEFTYFTEDIVDEKVYDVYIEKYIKEYLNISDYKIIDTEIGKIPMTNFPFESYNTKGITKIGTGGGWVKGSTGYSFKHTEKKVAQIILNLKQQKAPSNNLFKRKYRFYDKVFLKVLKEENDKGEWIFQQFYSKNSTETMFRFLDEESTFIEEVKIMCSLFSWSFIKAFFKTL